MKLRIGTMMPGPTHFDLEVGNQFDFNQFLGNIQIQRAIIAPGLFIPFDKIAFVMVLGESGQPQMLDIHQPAGQA